MSSTTVTSSAQVDHPKPTLTAAPPAKRIKLKESGGTGQNSQELYDATTEEEVESQDEKNGEAAGTGCEQQEQEKRSFAEELRASIPEVWQNALDDYLHDVDWYSTVRKLEQECEEHVVFPPLDMIFNALSVPPTKARVVILGQDPYHGPGQANGK